MKEKIIGLLLGLLACVFMIPFGLGNWKKTEIGDQAIEYLPIEPDVLSWGMDRVTVEEILGPADGMKTEFSTTTLTYDGMKTLFGQGKVQLIFNDDNLTLGERETGALGLVIVQLEIEGMGFEEVEGVMEKTYTALAQGSNEMLSQLTSGAGKAGIQFQAAVYTDGSYILGNLFSEDKLVEMKAMYAKWSRQPLEVLQKQSLLPITITQSGDGPVRMEFRAVDFVALKKAGII